MKYAIKFRKGIHYTSGSGFVSTKSRGNFRTKTSARNAILRKVHQQQPLTRKMSNKKILSVFRIVRR